VYVFVWLIISFTFYFQGLVRLFYNFLFYKFIKVVLMAEITLNKNIISIEAIRRTLYTVVPDLETESKKHFIYQRKIQSNPYAV